MQQSEITTRLEELEIKSAYQEDTINQLNDVIIRQQQEIDRLKAWYQEFTQRLDGITESIQGRLEDDVPPHY
ncbi:MAG: SlyX family protein [Xanthomonadales bacterium]|nr:SlyX family protein [Xanthomonadales bacterium]